MNRDLYEFAMNKINTISIDELERDLRAFGFECERKDKTMKSFKELLTEYGNAEFDCGEFDFDTFVGDDAHAVFDELADNANDLRIALLERNQMLVQALQDVVEALGKGYSNHAYVHATGALQAVGEDKYADR